MQSCRGLTTHANVSVMIPSHGDPHDDHQAGGRLAHFQAATHAQLPAAVRASAVRRHGALVAAGVFITVFATHENMAKLPIRSLIKDRLHLGPDATADFLAVASIGWFLKFVAGMLSDRVLFLGSRRRSYLVLSGVGGAACWTIAALVPERYSALLAVLVLVNAAAVLGNTALGGLLVEEGQRHDASSGFSALRVNAMNIASLAAGPIGAWLAGRAFGWTCMTGAGLMLVLALMTLVLVSPGQARLEPTTAPAERRARLQEIFRSRGVWTVAALSCFFYIAPGFANVLYYRQCDVLGFSIARIGFLQMINCACALAASIGFVRISRRIAPRRLLALGIVAYAMSSLFYLGYRSWHAALAIEAANGFLAAPGLLAIQNLAVRATPRGHEALGYALILSVANVGVVLSEVIGAHLSTGLGLEFRTLVILNAAVTAVTIFGIPLLPRSLLDHARR